MMPSAIVKRKIKALLIRLCQKVSSTESSLERLEKDLFKQYSLAPDQISLVFVLASPRTGSTLLYQLLAKYLRLYYFSNYIEEHFSAYPLVGTIFEIGLQSVEGEKEITLNSSYGATVGANEPNEASKVLQNWFSWEHPTETRSNRVNSDRRSHMVSTMSGIVRVTGKSIVIKNAWNCFRVQELSSLFPSAHFVWLRRDIIASSYSTLRARRREGDPSNVWNSASPFNFNEIRKRPYWEQVVEQQYWTNRAVENSLKKYIDDKKWTAIWYEKLLNNPSGELLKIAEGIGCKDKDIEEINRRLVSEPIELNALSKRVNDDDFSKIRKYAESTYPYLIRHLS